MANMFDANDSAEILDATFAVETEGDMLVDELVDVAAII